MASQDLTCMHCLTIQHRRGGLTLSLSLLSFSLYKAKAISLAIGLVQFVLLRRQFLVLFALEVSKLCNFSIRSSPRFLDSSSKSSNFLHVFFPVPFENCLFDFQLLSRNLMNWVESWFCFSPFDYLGSEFNSSRDRKWAIVLVLYLISLGISLKWIRVKWVL